MNARRYGYLYLTTNLETGRMYVGVRRGAFKPRYFGSGLALKRTIKKYGEDVFFVRVLGWADTMTELGEMEKKAIAEYRAIYGREGLYNISEGGYPWGGGMNGVSPTVATRKKLSDSLTGIPRTPEWRARISVALQGHEVSDETRKKMSLAKIGKPKSVPVSQETRAKLRAANLGKVLTPEHRLNLSIAHLGNTSAVGSIRTPEMRRAIGDRRRGTRTPEAAKAKISASLQGRILSETHRENLRQAALRQWAEKRRVDALPA